MYLGRYYRHSSSRVFNPGFVRSSCGLNEPQQLFDLANKSLVLLLTSEVPKTE